jgi:hypothetical protein
MDRCGYSTYIYPLYYRAKPGNRQDAESGGTAVTGEVDELNGTVRRGLALLRSS